MSRETIFSSCRRYRYTLWREWIGGSGDYCQFIGLNPSTADEIQDDPTVRRCIRFAQEWGYSGLCMTNAFAYRATDPRVMKAQPFPAGKENDRHLLEIAQGAGIVIAAWGTHGVHKGRDKEVHKLIREVKQIHCLGITKDGQPKHPLYLPADTQPIIY